MNESEKVIELMAEFILGTECGRCLLCDNVMKHIAIRPEGVQGCDGACRHDREYTKDDIIKMFVKESKRVQP